MYNITIEGNYIYIDKNGGLLLDRSSSDVTIVKANLDSDLYNVNLNDKCYSDFRQILWSDFTLDGVPFASQQDFEDWKNENTGNGSSSSNGGGTTPIERTPDTFNATTNGSTEGGVLSVGLLFRGNGGTLKGVPVPNNYSASFSPNKEDDTIGSIAYTVPNTGQQRVIITYVRS